MPYKCPLLLQMAKRKYAKSEKGRAAQKRYDQSEKGRRASKRYRESDAFKVSSEKWSKSPFGKASTKASSRRYRISEKGKTARRITEAKMKALYPEKIKARSLARSISSGVCEVEGCCVKGEKHHDDYSKPLEIRYLCNMHHNEL